MKIRTWWLNRVLLYWIPAIFVYDLATVVGRYGVPAALTNASIALVIVIFFEHYLFSYKVDLTPDTLHYSQGFIGSKRVQLRRDNIVAARFLPTPMFVKLTSARLLVKTSDENEHVMSLASFQPADISKIIKWLPIKPEQMNSRDEDI